MNTSELSSRSRTSNLPLLFVGFVLLILTFIGVVFVLFSGKAPVANVPIPAGQVEIRVEFEGLSTTNYNDLNAFVRELAKDHTDHLAEDFSGFHGLWNDGFVTRRYKPNHPIPSPEVERAMAARLESFFIEKGIDRHGEKLELRYGQ